MAGQVWGIEDQSNGVAGLVRGRLETALREAERLSETKGVWVFIYAVKGRTWTLKAKFKPDRRGR